MCFDFGWLFFLTEKKENDMHQMNNFTEKKKETKIKPDKKMNEITTFQNIRTSWQLHVQRRRTHIFQSFEQRISSKNTNSLKA